MSERLCRILRIHGTVQGVGFRYAIHREASRLGITGWARNRRDGTVEALVQGSPEAVEAILAWAHRGPPSAQVSRVDIDSANGSFASFELHPTA